MRRIGLFSLFLATVLSLASCYWLGNVGKGGLSIDVAGIKPKQEGTVVRVYLLADGKLFSTGGGMPFCAEVPYAYSEARISIQGLPVGPQYQALIGTGLRSGEVFTPDSYSKSGLFQVSPGTDTAVTVDPLTSINFSIAFCSELMGKNLKGVVASGGYVYAADESNMYWVYYDGATLYKNDYYDLIADPGAAGVSSFRVNGLSYDRAGLAGNAFINTPSGILPFSYVSTIWSFQPAFSSALPGSRDILESESFFDGQYNELFFRRANGLGGYSASTSTWVNLDVSGVLDMAASNNNAYFATTSGAFALPPAFLQDSTPTLAEHKMPLPLVPADTVSLCFSTSDNTLYMGTEDGVYMATVTESVGASPSVNMTSAIPIGNTAGQKINYIAVSPNSTNHQAFLSDYWLYIRKFGTVYEIPFFAVLPGKPTGMSWDSNYVLYISGTEGLSAVNVGFC